VTETSLHDRLVVAIEEDAVRPRELRLGLVSAMLAVVQPDLDAARQRAEKAEAEVKRLTAEVEGLTVRRDSWQEQANLLGDDADRVAAERTVQRQRAERAEAELAALRRRLTAMADAWEQQLPATILTATAVEVIRMKLEG
jgi:chromosome segregation ATPase